MPQSSIPNASLSAYCRFSFAYMFLHLTVVVRLQRGLFLRCLTATLALRTIDSPGFLLTCCSHSYSPPFSSPLPPLLPSTSRLARGQVGHLVMVVVVRADLLDQAVVRTIEGNVDTDDLERLGANPGHVALNLLLKAGLGRVVVAQ